MKKVIKAMRSQNGGESGGETSNGAAAATPTSETANTATSEGAEEKAPEGEKEEKATEENPAVSAPETKG